MNMLTEFITFVVETSIAVAVGAGVVFIIYRMLKGKQ